MDGAVGSGAIGKYHACPNASAESANGLPLIPLAGDFKEFSQACFDIHVHGPACHRREVLIPLLCPITPEPDRQRIAGIFLPYEREASSNSWRPRCLSR